MSTGAKLLALLVMAGALGGGYLYIRALQAERTVATNEAKTARDDLATANTTIKTLRADATKQADRIRTYQRNQDAIATDLAEKNDQYNRLLESNEQARIWAAGRLPDDVAGLHHHPVRTGAADYLRQGSAGADAVRTAGDGAPQ
jgi:LysB family phage lysis regulatory protein